MLPESLVGEPIWLSGLAPHGAWRGWARAKAGWGAPLPLPAQTEMLVGTRQPNYLLLLGSE